LIILSILFFIFFFRFFNGFFGRSSKSLSEHYLHIHDGVADEGAVNPALTVSPLNICLPRARLWISGLATERSAEAI
jgi:hypothetical protein